MPAQGREQAWDLRTRRFAIRPALLYEHDPHLAKHLLDEAGWVEGSDGIREEDGETLSFAMYGISSSETAVQSLTAYQEYWREFGVAMTPARSSLVRRGAITQVREARVTQVLSNCFALTCPAHGGMMESSSPGNAGTNGLRPSYRRERCN
jgi:hypothetical protein